jgi:DNA invertase Pin-like site-specific DNA recombinase
MGCERILFEKVSGLKDDRAAMKQLLRCLKPGDVVVFPAPDRQTRGGPFKMLRALDEITSRGASYKSLAEPFIDPANELDEIFAALVGWVARKTKDDILQRTSTGHERARRKGVKFG